MIAAVTGAGGHLGGNLVRALVARGDTVRALVRTDDRALTGLDVATFRGDFRDRRALDELIDGADVVFHLAAKVSIDPSERAEVLALNVGGARAVASACRERQRRLVHFSSIHALRTHDGPIDETRPLAKGHAFPYDRSKALGERAVLEEVARGLDAVTVNPTGVIGPYDFKPSHAGQMLLQLARRQLPTLVTGGFNWVDVRDVAAGAIAAAERGRAGERYLLSGHWCSVRELAETACRIAGSKPPRFDVPVGVAMLGVPFAAGYARLTRTRAVYTRPGLDALRHHKDVRHEKATRELGYTPRPLEETIRDSYGWFREAGEL
ncbi:MAG TPA: NAD-dependent epimerase/dehydratase family protein [Candidatus Polarisedimenticolaceae bacterium]|nr:NAD-dependent epimerase/dehydratase family protein [Candidatus Polarisedimenticolaceae bacterium]